jgi:hypothetical protein
VDAEWFARYLLSVDTSREGKPVVSVDDVKLLCAGHLTCDDRVVVDLLVKIARLTSGKLHSTEIIHVHVVEVGIDMLTELEIVVRIHDITHTLLDIIIVYIAVCNRHSIHGNDTTSMLTLITERMRQTKRDVHVALSLQTLRDTIVSSGESTEYVRRILPSKH